MLSVDLIANRQKEGVWHVVLMLVTDLIRKLFPTIKIPFAVNELSLEAFLFTVLVVEELLHFSQVKGTTM